jgi:hypothetical protein
MAERDCSEPLTLFLGFISTSCASDFHPSFVMLCQYLLLCTIYRLMFIVMNLALEAELSDSRKMAQMQCQNCLS